MKYQGLLFRDMIPYFEKNEINEVIALIKSRPVLTDYERSRNRIGFLKGN